VLSNAAADFAFPPYAADGAILDSGQRLAGSWFDVSLHRDDRLVLCVGRVSAGPATAEQAGNLRDALRTASVSAQSPSSALAAAQAQAGLPAGTTAEAAVAFYNPRTRALGYACAGRATPVLAISDGLVAALPTSATISLPPRALLVLAAGADGIARAIHHAPSMTATEAAADVLRRARLRGNIGAGAFVVLAVGDHSLRRFDYAFPAIPLAAPLVRASLRSFAQAAGLDGEQAFTLQTAVGEAVANVVEHAYETAPTGVVRVAATSGRHSVCVSVEDDGRWRSTRGRCDERGRGFPLMRALVDSVEISSRGSSTAVRLTMRLRH
jgi:anti-sigma regulatory factor (Ser/Thr protein kinase)